MSYSAEVMTAVNQSINSPRGNVRKIVYFLHVRKRKAMSPSNYVEGLQPPKFTHNGALRRGARMR